MPWLSPTYYQLVSYREAYADSRLKLGLKTLLAALHPQFKDTFIENHLQRITSHGKPVVDFCMLENGKDIVGRTRIRGHGAYVDINSAIVPHRRRQGLGSILLVKSIEYVAATGGDIIQAEIMETNESSWRRFERLCSANLAQRNVLTTPDGETLRIYTVSTGHGSERYIDALKPRASPIKPELSSAIDFAAAPK